MGWIHEQKKYGKLLGTTDAKGIHDKCKYLFFYVASEATYTKSQAWF